MPPSSRSKSSSGSPSKAETRSNNKRGSSKHSTLKSNRVSDEDEEGGAYETSVDEELQSDALDSDDEKVSKKRKRTSPKKKVPRPKKRGRKNENELGDEETDDELPEGQTVIGKVVQAPRNGQVPPGQISQNTLAFLKQLAKPECNDREWFKLHEPVYRQAEKEWNAWIEAFTLLLSEVDEQIPILPPKDVIHRIYRDVRFSNDKTPYKKGFSASFSRSGRKGIFAHYHVAIIPGGRSLIAAGAWQPGKNELATMRHHIQHNSSRLRGIICGPEFVKFFGDPNPHPKRERQSIFGHEDELKVAPKGIDKNHKDIDLLKLRSVAVVHNFLDSEVTASDFKENICKVVAVMKPLVHCLNDMMTLPVDGDDDEEDQDHD